VKVLLSWLRDFAPLAGDVEYLGDQMSDLGMAVELIDQLGAGLGEIVVARVVALRPHPDADRIQIVDVDAGGETLLQVCCGAFNMAEGDLVPLAPVGATLPDGMSIGRRKMRGEWSEGMLCSPAELGLPADDDGIMILGRGHDALDGSAVGALLVDALGIETDAVFDLEINPNRPDALSVAGVARDLAARLGEPFSLPEPPPLVGGTPADSVEVRLVDTDLCGRFAVMTVDGVTVGTSPAWLRRRLEAVGLRSVNNVVDVSNYVMWELGLPNHAYDRDTLARLDGGPVVLSPRWARPGERITTLDGIERELATGVGVIADADDVAVAVAGVMGGASTEVTSSTTALAVEFAWWQPMAVAVASRLLGLRSEASARYERGCDPDAIELAARRFAQLLVEVCPTAVVSGGLVESRGELPDPTVVTVRTSRVNRLLGTALATTDIPPLLTPIGFGCTGVGDDELSVTIPSWRPDTSTETDVIEEVARHLGYANLPVRRPAQPTTGGLSKRQMLRRRVRSTLVGLGASEAMPTPLLSSDDLATVGIEVPVVTITNPLAAEESVLRPSLRPGLLRAVAHNSAHRNPDVSLFEVGKVFVPADPPGVLPAEPEFVAVVLAGRSAPSAVSTLDRLCDVLGVTCELDAASPAGMHPTRSAVVRVGHTSVGLVGEIDPSVLERLGVVGPVAWCEVDLDAVTGAGGSPHPYRPVSRFPSTDIDLAFVLADSVPASVLRSAIATAAGPLLVALELFDVYRGPGIEQGSRSITHRLRLQAVDRTLTEAEVGEVRDAVVAAVATDPGARLR
jgi:phenylalanyl-tRNA synthetase beta chain